MHILSYKEGFKNSVLIKPSRRKPVFLVCPQVGIECEYARCELSIGAALIWEHMGERVTCRFVFLSGHSPGLRVMVCFLFLKKLNDVGVVTFAFSH